jgi:hypothetical protein
MGTRVITKAQGHDASIVIDGCVRSLSMFFAGPVPNRLGSSTWLYALVVTIFGRHSARRIKPLCSAKPKLGMVYDQTSSDHALWTLSNRISTLQASNSLDSGFEPDDLFESPDNASARGVFVGDDKLATACAIEFALTAATPPGVRTNPCVARDSAAMSDRTMERSDTADRRRHRRASVEMPRCVRSRNRDRSSSTPRWHAGPNSFGVDLPEIREIKVP